MGQTASAPSHLHVQIEREERERKAIRDRRSKKGIEEAAAYIAIEEEEANRRSKISFHVFYTESPLEREREAILKKIEEHNREEEIDLIHLQVEGP